MTIRDLGYTSYEGARNYSFARTSGVMLRHALRRAWGSTLVKVALFTCWIPLTIGCALWWGEQMVTQFTAGEAASAAPRVAETMNWTIWLFGFLITVGAGADAVSSDAERGIFPFYFSKAITASQYLVARVLAVWIWLMSVFFLPSLILVAIVISSAPMETRASQALLLLPAFGYALLASAALASASVGVSAISVSRTVTTTTWVALFLIPSVLSAIILQVGDWPWVNLFSIVGLVSASGQFIFGIESEEPAISGWLAMLILLGACGGLLAMAHQKITKAKVIQ